MEAKEIYESKINEVNNLQLYSHEEMEEAKDIEGRESFIKGILLGALLIIWAIWALWLIAPNVFNNLLNQ